MAAFAPRSAATTAAGPLAYEARCALSYAAAAAATTMLLPLLPQLVKRSLACIINVGPEFNEIFPSQCIDIIR